ncbi:MAG: extracellular solute-binding protein [Clostridia bacterium]|nr:extracellular solute-binding protein [Clostridia bacterium]
MLKRFLVWLMILTLSVGMVSFANAEETTTIRVLWWGSQNRHDLTTKAVELFEQKYPNINVEIEFTAWDGYWSKLSTQVAGNLVPDVIQMDYQYIAQYAQSNVLADLTPYFESGAIDISNVADTVLSSGKVGEGIYGMPIGTTARVMMYRPDVLEQANLTMPVNPTWDEFMSISKQVYEATGRTNIVPSDIDDLRFILRDYGLNLYSDDGKSLGFDDPKHLVYLWERQMTAVNEGWQLPVGETTALSMYDGFISDDWAECTHWSSELAAFQTGSGTRLELAMYPHSSDATAAATYFKPSMFWSVSNASANKDAAATFVNFFINDPDCYDIVGIDRGMPVSSAIREHIAPTLDETSQRVAAMHDYLGQEGMTSAIMNTDIPAHGEVNRLFADYSEQVSYGMVKDLTAHAQAFIEEANAIIAEKSKN